MPALCSAGGHRQPFPHLLHQPKNLTKGRKCTIISKPSWDHLHPPPGEHLSRTDSWEFGPAMVRMLEGPLGANPVAVCWPVASLGIFLSNEQVGSFVGPYSMMLYISLPLAPLKSLCLLPYIGAGWEILSAQPMQAAITGRSPNLCNQPTLAAKGIFPPVYVIAARGCSSCAVGVLLPVCSGPGEHPPLPSPPGLQPGGMGWSQEPSSTSPAKQQIFSMVKDESARNEAANLIFSKETTDRINILPQSGFWLHQITFLPARERRAGKVELALSVL